MASIIELVKELRTKTNAGFANCKKALEETNCDLKAAEEYLRKKGLMDASKKSSRITKEGLVAYSLSECLTQAAIIELNSETDFVAKNEKFYNFAKQLADIVLSKGADNVLEAKFDNGKTVQDELTFLISVIGENIQLRRAKTVSVKNGIIGSYTHKAITPGAKIGSIGILVCLESDNSDFNKDDAVLFGKKLAMHVAASNPQFMSIDSIPNDVLNKEKEIAKEQAVSSGKPENIAEKIAEGRLNKFYKEVVFSEQSFFEDDKLSVRQVIDKYNKDHNTNFKVTNFVRFQVGEE